MLSYIKRKQRGRRIIRKAKKISPNAFVVVTGCYAQLKPEEISDIHGVNLVLGAREKFNLPSLLKILMIVIKILWM